MRDAAGHVSGFLISMFQKMSGRIENVTQDRHRMTNVVFDFPPRQFRHRAVARSHAVVNDDGQTVPAQSHIGFDPVNSEPDSGCERGERIFGRLKVIPAMGE